MGQWLKRQVCKENLLIIKGITLDEIKMLYRNAGVSKTPRISIQLL